MGSRGESVATSSGDARMRTHDFSGWKEAEGSRENVPSAKPHAPVTAVLKRNPLSSDFTDLQ